MYLFTFYFYFHFCPSLSLPNSAILKFFMCLRWKLFYFHLGICRVFILILLLNSMDLESTIGFIFLISTYLDQIQLRLIIYLIFLHQIRTLTFIILESAFFCMYHSIILLKDFAGQNNIYLLDKVLVLPLKIYEKLLNFHLHQLYIQNINCRVLILIFRRHLLYLYFIILELRLKVFKIIIEKSRVHFPNIKYLAWNHRLPYF
jgi:hypothetical protein